MVDKMMQSRLACCLLLVATTSISSAESPLRVYHSCLMPDGVSGQCRNQPRQVAAPADVQAVPVLPIDMRLPCADANRTCAENVDVAEVPPQAPSGAGVSSCSVTLMPWAPFPCTYNTEAYAGVEGQNKTSWCYSQHTKPQQQGYELARDLVTDGYTNLYHGWLPDAPCGPSSSSSSGSSSVRMAGLPGYGRHFTKVLLTLKFRVAAGRQFDRTYWFQIGRAVAAVGTLTEPTRWLGTDKWWSTTVDVTHLQAYLRPGLPTRCSIGNLLSNTYNVPLWGEATLQFYWTQEAPSGTHVQPLDVQPLEPAAGGATAAPTPPATAPRTAAARAPHKPVAATAAAAPAPAHVPDEVVPLIPKEDDAGSAIALVGQGDSPPASWPQATFKLPAGLSAPGNIYRAQLLVTPKADSCEEFWAMNPSGAGTNSTCGGLSTGEPYREVRVYVNGQLAGFTPIYYTMYTGGVDPRLWSAIVASYTYNLPTYTFDLSPWLPQLNTQPKPGPSTKRPTSPVTISSSSSSDDASFGAAEQPVASRRLTQDTSAAATPPTAATDAGRQVPSTTPAGAAPPSDPSEHHQPQQPEQQPQPDEQQQWATAVDAGSAEASHTVTLELAGATGNGWLVGSTLLLWRAVDADGRPQAVEGQEKVEVETTPGFDAPLSSNCEPLEGPSNTSDSAVAGKCSLKVRDRSFRASSVLQWQGHRWEARVRYATSKYDNIITFNNGVNVTDGALTWYQETHHEAAWSVTRQQPTAAAAEQGSQDHKRQRPGAEAPAPAPAPAAAAALDLSSVLTQSSVRFDWLNAGVVAAGGAFEYSFNSTRLQPTVYVPASLARGQAGAAERSRGSSSSSDEDLKRAAHVVIGDQRHYQRAIMLSVYTPTSPKCVVPDNATHTVTLHHSSPGGSTAAAGTVVGGGGVAAGGSCVRRFGTCGFCGASLMRNIVEWDC